MHTATPPRKINLSLRVVFYRQEGLWIAHCLEMDVMGHGDQMQDAFTMLEQAVLTQIGESVHRGNLSNIFQPADGHVFQMYFSGLPVEMHDDIPGDAPIAIDRIDTHEFQEVALSR